MSDELVAKALAAKRESRCVEFKEAFDATSNRDWCEIVKDVVAIANSGGGIIVFGVNNRGEPTGKDLSSLRSIDPAKIMDRLQPYTNSKVTELEIEEPTKNGHNLLVWIVLPNATPTVFSKPGTYAIEGGSQRTAFSQGTVYFRHGAKSEPGTSEDIAKALERRIEAARKGLLRGLRKVVEAPTGSQVNILPPEIRTYDAPDATRIRITDDPAAPVFRLVDPDSTHPFRQKELIAEVRRRCPSSAAFNSFDVVSIRRVYEIDGKHQFVHKPRFGTRQYSKQFVDWIISQVESDPEFLSKTRARNQIFS